MTTDEKISSLIELHRSTIQVMSGLQRQIEGLRRLANSQNDMLTLLAGGDPDARTKALGLSEQAAREIAELEALFSKDIPPASGDTPNGEAQ